MWLRGLAGQQLSRDSESRAASMDGFFRTLTDAIQDQMPVKSFETLLCLPGRAYTNAHDLHFALKTFWLMV